MVEDVEDGGADGEADRRIGEAPSREVAQRPLKTDRHQAGCVLIWTLGHHEFGAIINCLARQVTDRPDAEQRRDLSIEL